MRAIYHPDPGGPAYLAVLGEHPAVVGQQHLERVAHGDDEGHPQARAEEDTADHVLRLAGHAAAGETTQAEHALAGPPRAASRRGRPSTRARPWAPNPRETPRLSARPSLKRLRHRSPVLGTNRASCVLGQDAQLPPGSRTVTGRERWWPARDETTPRATCTSSAGRSQQFRAVPFLPLLPQTSLDFTITRETLTSSGKTITAAYVKRACF